MGGTVCDLSAPEASPNAIHEEKHEQFTPRGDVNSRRLLSLVEVGGFVESRNKD